jgi:hypothetical protein
MRIAITVLTLALSGTVHAQHHREHHPDNEIVFTSTRQLLSWCEEEARAYYADKGITTYQWSGRHFESGNTLHAEGEIRTSENDVSIKCHAPKGARERNAVIKIGS